MKFLILREATMKWIARTFAIFKQTNYKRKIQVRGAKNSAATTNSGSMESNNAIFGGQTCKFL